MMMALKCALLDPSRPIQDRPFFYDAIKKGLLNDCNDFYENKHTNSDLLSVNFTELTDDEFHQCLCEANSKLLSNYFTKKLANMISQTEKLYLEKDASFRGYRQI
jgi:hypothetical protein